MRFRWLCSRRAATFNHGPATMTSARDHGTRIRWMLSLKATVQAFWCFSGLISSTFTLVFGSGSVQGTTLLAPSLPDILGVLLRIHRYTKNIWEYIMVGTFYCSQWHIPHDLIVQFRPYCFRYPKFDILVTDHRPTYPLWYDVSAKQQAFTTCTYLPIKWHGEVCLPTDHRTHRSQNSKPIEPHRTNSQKTPRYHPLKQTLRSHYSIILTRTTVQRGPNHGRSQLNVNVPIMSPKPSAKASMPYMSLFHMRLP